MRELEKAEGVGDSSFGLQFEEDLVERHVLSPGARSRI
jgi:hypothetical protein